MIYKELYTSPEVKVFEVRIGGVVCTSNPNLLYGNPGEAGGGFGDGGSFDL